MHIDATDGSEDVAEAIRATAADTEDAVRNMQEDEAMTPLSGPAQLAPNDLYEAATAALREDTQQSWADTLASDPAELEEDEEPFTTNPEGLRALARGRGAAVVRGAQEKLAPRLCIREQAFGESLEQDQLERLGQSEIHLNRKFERTLSHVARPQRPAARGDRGATTRHKTNGGATCASREDLSRPCGARASLTGCYSPASRNPPIGFQLPVSVTLFSLALHRR